MSQTERPERGETCAVCGARLPDAPMLAGPDRLMGTAGTFTVTVCPSCGAGTTTPPASATELAVYYPPHYGSHGLPTGGAAKLISAAIRRWQGWVALRTEPLARLREGMPGRAVDVGCGRGDLAATLIARGWRVTGIDPSEQAVAVARSRGVDARAGTLADVPLEPGAYHAAIFNQSLEHTPDPVGDLRRAREALEPDGLVLVSVPNFGSWQRRRFGSRWFHLDLPRHRLHFDAASLTRALELAGFIHVESTTSTSAVGLAGTLQYALLGRCLFPGGLPLRVASGLAVLAYPLARLADRLAGGGDMLHATARAPHASSEPARG